MSTEKRAVTGVNNERRDRPGHTISRRTKGHPRRQARRDRAAARLEATK